MEGMKVFPFLRILGAQKAVIAEAMIILMSTDLRCS